MNNPLRAVGPVWLAGAWAAAGLALTAGGCARKAETSAERPPSSVTVATARAADVPLMLETFGRLRAVADVDVKPQVSGRIVAAPFEEGALVAQGDVLFMIETETYQAEVDQAAAQVASARIALDRRRATLERNRRLLEQNLVSQEDYDELVKEAEKARADLDRLQALLAKARVDLERCTITAPVTGYTGRRLVDAGNVVSGSGGPALVNIRAIDELYLDFTLSESQLPDVRRALSDGKVEVLLVAESPAGESGMYPGELRLIDNTVDTQSGTIRLRALVDNRHGGLWPGQFVYVLPILRTIKQAVIVPSSAIARGKAGPYAYVVKDGQAELRMVEQGPPVADAVIVKSGLAAGDVVVTAGHMGVWPGAALHVRTEPDEVATSIIRRRLDNPNVLNFMRVLAVRGETVDDIALIVGIPSEKVQSVIDAAGEPK